MDFCLHAADSNAIWKCLFSSSVVCYLYLPFEAKKCFVSHLIFVLLNPYYDLFMSSWHAVKVCWVVQFKGSAVNSVKVLVSFP